jgi:hypothetical protein
MPYFIVARQHDVKFYRVSKLQPARWLFYAAMHYPCQFKPGRQRYLMLVLSAENFSMWKSLPPHFAAVADFSQGAVSEVISPGLWSTSRQKGCSLTP